MRKSKMAMSALALAVTANSYAIDLGNGFDIDEATKTLTIVIDKGVDGATPQTMSGNYSEHTSELINGTLIQTFNNLSNFNSNSKNIGSHPATIGQLTYSHSDNSIIINTHEFKSDQTESNLSIDLYSIDKFPTNSESITTALLNTDTITINLNGRVEKPNEAPSDTQNGELKTNHANQNEAADMECKAPGELHLSLTMHSDKFDANALFGRGVSQGANAIENADGSISLSVDGISRIKVDFDKKGKNLDLSLLGQNECKGFIAAEGGAQLGMAAAMLPILLPPTEMPHTSKVTANILSFFLKLASPTDTSPVAVNIKGIDTNKIIAEVKYAQEKKAEREKQKVSLATQSDSASIAE